MECLVELKSMIWTNPKYILIPLGSAPLPVLDKLSQMYPDLKFDFEFADEDIGRNAGCMLIQNGEILKGGFLDDCKEACETYFRLWGGETDYRFNENTGTYEYIDEEVM